MTPIRRRSRTTAARGISYPPFPNGCLTVVPVWMRSFRQRLIRCSPADASSAGPKRSTAKISAASDPSVFAAAAVRAECAVSPRGHASRNSGDVRGLPRVTTHDPSLARCDRPRASSAARPVVPDSCQLRWAAPGSRAVTPRVVGGGRDRPGDRRGNDPDRPPQLLHRAAVRGMRLPVATAQLRT